MIVIGVDPGTEQTAVVAFNGTSVTWHIIAANAAVLVGLRTDGNKTPILVIEEFESYGMAVGREVFRTIRWAGNFEEAWFPGRVEFLPRRIIKQHICHTARATDANIRQELLDRFGGQEKAVGKKASPGPLYGIKSHAWAALAVAATWFELHGHEPVGEIVRPGIIADF